MADHPHRRNRRESTSSLTTRRSERFTPVRRTIIEISDDEPDDRRSSRRVNASSRRHRSAPVSEFGAQRRHKGESRRVTGVEVRRPRQSSNTQHHKRIKTKIEDDSFTGKSPSHAKPRSIRQTSPASPNMTLAAGNPHHSRHHSKSKRRSHGWDADTPTSFSNLDASSDYSRRKFDSKRKHSAERPPYYVDSRLGAKMYRGPGYERFPVVLGTVKGHQELCDKWDAEKNAKLTIKASKLQRGLHSPYVIHDTDSETGEESNGHEGNGVSIREEQCLAGVLDVLPNVDRAFVMKKIHDSLPRQKYYDDYGGKIDSGTTRIAEQIIAEILELDSYPKESITKPNTERNAEADDGTGVTITWNRDQPKGDMYSKDAVLLLALSFDHVPTHYIANVVAEKKSIFDAYVFIHDLENRFYSHSARPYHRLHQPRAVVEKKYQLGDYEYRIPDDYANRINELQAAKQHVARVAIQAAAKKAKAEEEAANLARHKKDGAVMECQCCFDDQVPLNRLVSCVAEQPHFFCFSCVEGLANTQVGLMKYEMSCMDGSGCTSELSRDGVGKAVPIKTFDRLQLNRQQAEITAAGIEGLEQCRLCDFKAICDEVSIEPVFYCQNPDCFRATCRKCNKDSHPPKTCEENQKETVLSARHLVEEARSEAVMRTCPKCRVKIVKEVGCNKMRCTNCSTIICYECKEDLTALSNAYDHFNKVGGKCSLYDEHGVDRHEAEAYKAEAEAIGKVTEKDADFDASKLRIETDKPTPRPMRPLNDGGYRLNPGGYRQIPPLPPIGPRRHAAMLELVGPPNQRPAVRRIPQGDGAHADGRHPLLRAHWAEMMRIVFPNGDPNARFRGGPPLQRQQVEPDAAPFPAPRPPRDITHGLRFNDDMGQGLDARWFGDHMPPMDMEYPGGVFPGGPDIYGQGFDMFPQDIPQDNDAGHVFDPAVLPRSGLPGGPRVEDRPRLGQPW